MSINPSKLGPEEIKQFEEYNRLAQVAQLQTDLFTANLQLLSCEIRLRDEQKKNIEHEKVRHADVMQKQKDDRTAYMEIVKAKYGITAKVWGYSPETGEIRTSDE